MRINTSMDEGLVTRLDAVANLHGMSGSAFLAEAMRSAPTPAADAPMSCCHQGGGS